MNDYSQLVQRYKELKQERDELAVQVEVMQQIVGGIKANAGNPEFVYHSARDALSITPSAAPIDHANEKENRTMLTKPELNEGEVYVGAIINPDGTGNHVILLPGDNDNADWQTQMDWAKSIGGDLPDRVEQAMLYKHHSAHFQPDWYWSNTQHGSGSAWNQYFWNGHQYWSLTDTKCRARAVRRVAI